MADIVFHDGDRLIALVVDATPEERHRASAHATEHEVARGAPVTDHVRPERRTMTLSVVITDTPVEPTAAMGGAVRTVELALPPRQALVEGAVEERATPSVRATLYEPSGAPTRVADSWALLIDARDRALLATITTRLETYEDMALVEVTATRTAADGTWIRAELTFGQVRQVATELVDDPVATRPRDQRQQGKGSQSTEEAPARVRSGIVRIADALGETDMGRGLRSLLGGS